jgi:hypothetical protein
VLGRRRERSATGRSGVTVKAPNFQLAAFHTPHTTALSATTLLLATGLSSPWTVRCRPVRFRECLWCPCEGHAGVVPRDVYYTSTDEQL